MTKSTGKRAAQRRREELFSAEMMLRGVERHLLDAYSWATRYRDAVSAQSYNAAFAAVNGRLREVLAEVQEMA